MNRLHNFTNFQAEILSRVDFNLEEFIKREISRLNSFLPFNDRFQIKTLKLVSYTDTSASVLYNFYALDSCGCLAPCVHHTDFTENYNHNGHSMYSGVTHFVEEPVSRSILDDIEKELKANRTLYVLSVEPIRKNSAFFPLWENRDHRNAKTLLYHLGVSCEQMGYEIDRQPYAHILYLR